MQMYYQMYVCVHVCIHECGAEYIFRIKIKYAFFPEFLGVKLSASEFLVNAKIRIGLRFSLGFYSEDKWLMGYFKATSPALPIAM